MTSIVEPRDVDGRIWCPCGMEMIPQIGRNLEKKSWQLWWWCESGAHISCAIPVPSDGVSTMSDVRDHGSARVLDSPLAQPPEGSLHR